MANPIGFIGTSQEMLDMAKTMSTKMDNSVIIRMGGLERAVPVALQMREQEGVEVILSLRGTAKILQRHIDIPILSMPDSTKNRIIAIKNITKFAKNIILPVYKGENYDINFLESLFRIKITTKFYTDIESLEQIIAEAKQQRYDCVVGGGLAMSISKKYSIPCALVLPTMADIEVGLENAINIERNLREERNALAKQKLILDSISEGIITVDTNLAITSINKIAQKIFSITDECVGKNIDSVIKEETNLNYVIKNDIARTNEIKEFNDNQYVINSIPIRSDNTVIGCLCTLQSLYKMMKTTSTAQRSTGKGHITKYALDDYKYRSRLMSGIMEKIRYFAACDSTVLLTGQSGTGKEILAHGIHRASQRSNGPFVSVNCSALPANLLESELFGYEEGAFTGSKRGGKQGLFELADRGTLFLDEINSMSQSLQAMLLRVLQEQELRRVGGDSVIRVNVRIIAATNRSLAMEVQEGRMREDLFFRLNVLTVEIPPLAKRPDDIPLLFEEFMQKACAKNGQPPLLLPPSCMARLCALPWKGNARELEYFVERLVVLSKNGFHIDTFEDLYTEVTAYATPQTEPAVPRTIQPDLLPTREQIEKALAQASYRKGHAAMLLGIGRTTLWRMMTQLGIPARRPRI